MSSNLHLLRHLLAGVLLVLPLVVTVPAAAQTAPAPTGVIREITDAVIRLGVKKAAEFAIRKENQNLGTAVGIFNALSEKADTRNWQTLPYSIYYTRVFSDPGEKEVEFITQGK